MTFRQEVQAFVSSRQGCKAMELCAESTLVLGAIKEGVNLPDLLEDMVNNCELVEVEYEIPQVPGRCKSFLLPPGSIILNVRE